MDAAKEPPTTQHQQHQQQVNKAHAHSTSFLASDSYIAGMSSDSELTARSSHHHRRPYSSQSRVYHAHPAPRGAQGGSTTLASSSHSSSRVSPHYSDSSSPAASYLAANHKSMSVGSSHLMGGRHLPHQGSVSYLSSTLPGEQVEQQQQRRQLPMRPYKQSMSIDQQPGSLPLTRPYRQQYLPEHAHSEGQRNYRLEMELAGMCLYDGRPPVPEGAGRRQLPSTELPPLQSPQQQQQQHLYQQQDFYQPTDWMSPVGHQQAHFKQTMSIDHYPMSVAGLHYPRGSPLGYTTSSPAAGFESPLPPTGHQHPPYHQPAPLPGELHYPSSSSYGLQQQQRLLQGPYSSPVEPPLSSPGAPAGRALSRPPSASADSPYRPKAAKPLEHQASSGSGGSGGSSGGGGQGDLAKEAARSQSGQSNNGNGKQPSIDQKSHFHHHIQQQQAAGQRQASGYELASSHTGLSRHALLRKGHTSSAGLGGSSSQLDEFVGDLSSSSSAQLQQQQQQQPSVASQLQHLVGKVAGRSAKRAGSPSAAFAIDGSQFQHHHSKEAGTRSESSTGLPNGGRGGTSGGAHSVGIGADGSSGSLTKKSNSATQLSMTGTKKRLGFRKKQVTSFSVHRSEEVAPLEARHLVKQGSSVSEGDSSMSGDSSSRSWSNSNFKQANSDELASMSFIDGLGKGQMISRQGLASPYLGDIQLSLCDRRGNLEVEVIRARNLQAKTNKILPLTYVKLYLVKNRKCLAKAKTTLSNKRTLDPLFQQLLTFHEDYHGCILQSIVWGNFGKMDKKNFMGIAQISIDDLELADTVISWYKLFLPSSLQTLPSKSLRHTLLSNSTESFTTTNNS